MPTQRSAFPEQVPRPVKREGGRTDTGSTPVNIRVDRGLTVDDAGREHIRTRLGRALSKHAQHIERTTVRLLDVNGPRGGVDTVCRIKVVLTGLASVVVEERGATALEAFDLAANGVPRAVGRALERVEGRRTAS